MSTHPLRIYLDKNNESLRAFADKVDTTAATLSRIINGQDCSLDLIRRISAETNGKVTANDFAGFTRETAA